MRHPHIHVEKNPMPGAIHQHVVPPALPAWRPLRRTHRHGRPEAARNGVIMPKNAAIKKQVTARAAETGES